jgi:DNA-binding transcriptional MerR regulator
VEWSIQEVARASGTTSRTLRHYDDVGLLKPARVGPNGYRFYDPSGLARLQRILLLRGLGLGLGDIRRVLEGQADDVSALTGHLDELRREKARIDRQIRSVETTIRKWKGGEQLMANEMFDGFDHTQYREEVEERWGEDAYARGDRWWRSMNDDEKREFGERHLGIARDYGDASAAGLDPASDEVQSIARRHYEWLKAPVGEVSRGYFEGLGQMYVDDPRFAANYTRDGVAYAEYVRDAMRVFAERNL